MIGRIEFSCHWQNPMTTGWLTSFPVIPVGFRMDDSGAVNGLGTRFERLVEVNAQLAKSLPARKHPSYITEGLLFGHPDLDAAMSELLGGHSSGVAVCDHLGQARPDCLLGLLHQAVSTVDPEFGTIARSCGIGMRLSATL
jgi:hypothetical protein